MTGVLNERADGARARARMIEYSGINSFQRGTRIMPGIIKHFIMGGTNSRLTVDERRGIKNTSEESVNSGEAMGCTLREKKTGGIHRVYGGRRFGKRHAEKKRHTRMGRKGDTSNVTRYFGIP